METIDWLLDSDPAISWQAMRDLTDASPAALGAERARVPREGLGAEILASQGGDGSWHRNDAPDWLPTLYTMLLLGLGLRELSMAPHQVPQIKRVVRSVRMDQARELAARVLTLDGADVVIEHLRAALRTALPEPAD